MVDRPSFSSPSKRVAGRRRKNGALWFLRLGLATLLFFLTAVVHLTHTCTSHQPLPFGPPSPSLGSGERQPGLQQDPVEEPCLACLFLHSLNAAKIASLHLDLSWLRNLQQVSPDHPSLCTRDSACRCFIRAPPCSAFPG